MLLNVILNDFDSFKAEIEKRRNRFYFDFDDVFPMSPTECMNTPIMIIPPWGEDNISRGRAGVCALARGGCP